jgi:hypothetical protein
VRWAPGIETQDTDEEAPVEVVAQAKASLRPELAREFALALADWKDFRTRTCALVALQKGNTLPDRGCLYRFSSLLRKKAGEAIQSIEHAEARMKTKSP